MKEEVVFTVEETLRLFRFLERSNELFHQPMSYSDMNTVEKFAMENYPEIKELYNNLIWEKLPKNIQDQITEE